jgi:hypothetical protein
MTRVAHRGIAGPPTAALLGSSWFLVQSEDMDIDKLLT